MQMYLPDTNIEIINDKITRGKIKHALFDFDGTISLIRENWQSVMIPLMIKMICGKYKPTLEIKKRVKDYVDESTGIQTLLQMEYLVELIKEYGLVPSSEILTAYEYKQIYNQELLVIVNKRLQKLAEGKISIEKLSVKGSIEFIKILYNAGVTLYLASGTDVEYVEKEAFVLKVTQYFKERIFGALRTIEEYSKDKVIKKIIQDYKLKGYELCIFGDGKVEIRNAKENNAIAVGVASNEKKGEGLDPYKREKLIKAGADIIIPDFKEKNKLFHYLF